MLGCASSFHPPTPVGFRAGDVRYTVVSVLSWDAHMRVPTCAAVDASQITFGVASVCGFVPGVRSFILLHYWICIVALVLALVLQLGNSHSYPEAVDVVSFLYFFNRRRIYLSIVSSITLILGHWGLFAFAVLVCVPNLGRKVPTNFVMMTMITLCYSIILGYGAASSSRDAFLIAIGTTFVVVVGLMLFACQTKYDFTGKLHLQRMLHWCQQGIFTCKLGYLSYFPYHVWHAVQGVVHISLCRCWFSLSSASYLCSFRTASCTLCTPAWPHSFSASFWYTIHK